MALCSYRNTTPSTSTRNTAAATSAPSSPHSSHTEPPNSPALGPLSPPPPPPPVLSPCAACKILRRRCVEKCVLAPYFPPTDPLRFTIAHRIFGAGNIIKVLQELPESQRADAVSSMVYEANARIRDPVYGCAGAISQLQKQVSELQAELAKAQAEIVSLQSQSANLLSFFCMDISEIQRPIFQQQEILEQEHALYDSAAFFMEDGWFGLVN